MPFKSSVRKLIMFGCSAQNVVLCDPQATRGPKSRATGLVTFCFQLFYLSLQKPPKTLESTNCILTLQCLRLKFVSFEFQLDQTACLTKYMRKVMLLQRCKSLW